MSRNNTNFIKILIERLKKIKVEKDDPLNYHQKITNTYFNEYNIRGLLCYYEPGAGKTRLAVSISEDFLQSHKGWKVLFISTKSLHDNMRNTIIEYRKMVKKESNKDNVESTKDNVEFSKVNSELTKDDVLSSVDNLEFTGSNDDYIMANYTFISMNASNMIKQVTDAVSPDVHEIDEDIVKFNLENTFVIIDEAHNLFNSIANGSQNAIKLYEMIMAAKDIRLLFLTGSPIVNDPYEAALCYNMLSGKVDGKTLFGDDYAEFTKYFVKDGMINNADKFANRIVGLTSYKATGDSDFESEKGKREANESKRKESEPFPILLEPIVEKVYMSDKQYSAYSIARIREREEVSKSSKFNRAAVGIAKPKGRSTTYRVRSRQYSNVLYPESAMELKTDEYGHDASIRIMDKLGPDCFDHLDVYSPKAEKMLGNLAKHSHLNKKGVNVGPGIIYSQFIESGIGFISRLLKYKGYYEVTGNKSLVGKKDGKLGFAVISGEVPPEVRTEIIDIFNDEQNKDGSVISVLLITSTGAEGIDTKRVRHIHVFEPYWNWSRLKQVFHRGKRLYSHIDLPLKDRNVQPYIYLSDYPKSLKDDKKEGKKELHQIEKTTDISLYEDAVENQNTINSFLHVMIESAIDCYFHHTKDIKCRICMPDNRKMFIADLYTDMTSENCCTPLSETKIKATEIEFNGNKYSYMYDNGKLRIFAFDELVGAYREIFSDDESWVNLRDLVENKKKKK